MHKERPSVFFSLNKYMIQIEPLEAEYNHFVFYFALLRTYSSFLLYCTYHGTQFKCCHSEIIFLLLKGCGMPMQGLIQTSALHSSLEKQFLIHFDHQAFRPSGFVFTGQILVEVLPGKKYCCVLHVFSSRYGKLRSFPSVG